jgi:transcriptional regulator with XRE-family HTH domain
MGRFSITLKDIIAQRFGGQKEAVAAFGIPQGSISQYINMERVRPRDEQLTKILDALEYEDRVRLMHAVLQDAIPDERYADLCLIEPTGEASKMREVAREAWREVVVSKQGALDLETIAAAMCRHADIDDVIHGLAEFIRSTTEKK